MSSVILSSLRAQREVSVPASASRTAPAPQTARGFAHQRRRIAAEGLQQRSHRVVGTQQGKDLRWSNTGSVHRDRSDGPSGVTKARPDLDPAIAQHAQHPQRPRDAPKAPGECAQLGYPRLFGSLRQVVPGQLNFERRRARHLQIIGIQRRSQARLANCPCNSNWAKPLIDGTLPIRSSAPS